jgi:hypothetical protein
VLALVAPAINGSVLATPDRVRIVTTASTTQETSATPLASRSFEWSRIDVTLDLDNSGEVHVTERMEVAFRGGPFRFGFREIPLDDGEQVRNVQVAEVRHGESFPYTEINGSFDPNVPETYLVQVEQEIGAETRVDWSFIPTSDASRTFILEYDFTGAVNLVPAEAPRYQELTWIVVDNELSSVAPVDEATITVRLPQTIDASAAAGMAQHTREQPVISADRRTWTWSVLGLPRGETLIIRMRIPLAALGTPESATT